jgi:hypothetical protein
MKRKKYDLIFGIGQACSCTQALRDARLQEYSYPFDWLYGSDFLGRIKILTSKFNRFIDFEDLQFSHNDRAICKDAYYNKFNDITFNHDFPGNVPLQESYAAVKLKYDRRISRLLSQIESAKNILIAYIEIPMKNHVKVPSEQLLEGYKKLAQIFTNKQIDLLYFANEKEVDAKIENISANITKITVNYKSTDASLPDYAVDFSILKKFLEKYKLKIPASKKIKKIFLSIFVKCIPFKKIRRELKRKYHVK